MLQSINRRWNVQLQMSQQFIVLSSYMIVAFRKAMQHIEMRLSKVLDLIQCTWSQQSRIQPNSGCSRISEVAKSRRYCLGAIGLEGTKHIKLQTFTLHTVNRRKQFLKYRLFLLNYFVCTLCSGKKQPLLFSIRPNFGVSWLIFTLLYATTVKIGMNTLQRS